MEEHGRNYLKSLMWEEVQLIEGTEIRIMSLEIRKKRRLGVRNEAPGLGRAQMRKSLIDHLRVFFIQRKMKRLSVILSRGES